MPLIFLVAVEVLSVWCISLWAFAASRELCTGGRFGIVLFLIKACLVYNDGYS